MISARRTPAIWLFALAACAVFVVGAWYLGQSLGTHLTIVFGIVALAGSIVTADLMREIGQMQKNSADTLFSIQSTGERLKGDVDNLEDATRRILNGFDEIFARALWLLNRSEMEIWYVNFLFSFGEPHAGNPEVCTRYDEQATTLGLQNKFSAAITEFSNRLCNRVQQVERFHAVVLNENSLDQLFFERILKRPGYATLSKESLVDKERNLVDRIIYAGKSRGSNEGFRLHRADRLPLQLLIAQIPSNHSQERKFGCLVFLVGTENADGKAIGFYSELDAVARMYIDFANSLFPDEILPITQAQQVD